MIKPPLGVMPQSIWLYRRKIELSRAIYEYIETGAQFGAVQEWADELAELLRKDQTTRG